MGLLDQTITMQQELSLDKLVTELVVLEPDELHAFIIELDSEISDDKFTDHLVRELNRAMSEPVFQEEE